MKKLKGFKAFDGLMRKLVKVPPAELPAGFETEECPVCHGKGFDSVYPRNTPQRVGCGTCNETGRVPVKGKKRK
jgi:hypothetical protein